MLPINKKISDYNYFNTNNVRYIVIHDVGTTSTAKNNADYFAGGQRGASAHYFVDDASIWQSVEDYHGAWHCGDGQGAYGIHNQNSIGIEMCLSSGAVTAQTEQNTLELVRYLMQKYNVPVNCVVRHYDASRKNCPAQFNLDGKWTRWTAFKTKLTQTDGWSQVNGKWQYTADGQLCIDGWRYIDGKWYAFDADGWMLTGWYAKGDKWYYLTPQGDMHTGWSLIDGKWYLLGADGVMVEGWTNSGGKWYYLQANGVMAQGWLQDKSGAWYYLNIPDGEMVTGTKSIDGKRYEFDLSGKCLNP